MPLSDRLVGEFILQHHTGRHWAGVLVHGQPDVAFACSSLVHTKLTGKGWPLLKTDLFVPLRVPTKTDLHSSPSPPPPRNRHVEARLR